MSPSPYLKYILLINIYTFIYLTPIISMPESQEQNGKESPQLREELMIKSKYEQKAKQKTEQKAKEKAEKGAKPKNLQMARSMYKIVKSNMAIINAEIAKKQAREKAEQEAKRKAEQAAKEKAERESKPKVEQEDKQKAEQEAREKAEQEAKQNAEQEAKRKAEAEAREKDEEKEKLENSNKEKKVRDTRELAEAQVTEIDEQKANEKIAEMKAQQKAKLKNKQKFLQTALQRAKQKAKENANRSCSFTGNSDRIVGGHIAKENTYPWLGVLQVNGKFHCSVNIIDKWWVLTAAHAFMDLDKNNLSMFSIEVGNIERNKGTVYGVSKIIADTYDRKTKLNDIALMKIKGPIKFNHRVMPICLPRKNDPHPKVGERLTVAGWGFEEFKSGEVMTKLKEVRLTLISRKECAEIYQERKIRITKSQLCTYEDNKDACQGDSGGPAVKLIDGFETLVGLVSYGITCADNYPGVYTKVSHYIKWIKNVIESNK